MSWPTPQDYNEAIQNPGACFAHPELRRGAVAGDRIGLPRPWTGAFASVYRVKTDERDWAVRCFLSVCQDRHERYAALSRFICADALDFTVSFQFLEKGILARGKWLPVVIMEWIDGLSLDEFVAGNLQNRQKLLWLAGEFARVVQEMELAGIAHGDLQHGNVVVREEQVFLIDYDGMFVPELAGKSSTEVGHRNYQHPRRNNDHFGAGVDNFSAWVIYCSLVILAHDPLLGQRLLLDRDGLLFRHDDFLRADSEIFRLLDHHGNSEIVVHGRAVRALLGADPMAVPQLKLPLDIAGLMSMEALAELSEAERNEVIWPASVARNLRDDKQKELPARRTGTVWPGGHDQSSGSPEYKPAVPWMTPAAEPLPSLVVAPGPLWLVVNSEERASLAGESAPAPVWLTGGDELNNSVAVVVSDKVMIDESLLKPWPLLADKNLKFGFAYLEKCAAPHLKPAVADLRLFIAAPLLALFLLEFVVLQGLGLCFFCLGIFFLPVLLFILVSRVNEGEPAWSLRLSRFARELKLGDGVNVEFNIGEFPETSGPRAIIRPTRKLPREAGESSQPLCVPVKNWQDLDLRDKQRLPLEGTTPGKGTLYYYGFDEKFQALVLVTEFNTALWFFD